MVKQILPKAGEAILALFNKLGGNMNNVLGSRSNITFLGKGKSPEGLIDMDINIEAVGTLGKDKVLKELESSIGYLTAGKLNDVQANKLLQNMQRIDEVFNPIANITDLGTGTRNLDVEGLGSLRTGSRQMTDDEYADFVDEIGGADRLEAYTFDGTIKDAQRILAEDKAYTDEMFSQYKAGKLDPQPGEANREKFLRGKFEEMEASGDKRLMTRDEIEELSAGDYMTDEGVMASETILPMRRGNQGGNPAKRANAREFLVEALKEDDTFATKLGSVVSQEDVKFITEGGGGIAGDPLALVEKYFGPRILEMIPSGASNEEIIIFTKRVMNNVEDASGLKPDNPRFDRFTARFVDEVRDFAKGGLAKILEV